MNRVYDVLEKKKEESRRQRNSYAKQVLLVVFQAKENNHCTNCTSYSDHITNK